MCCFICNVGAVHDCCGEDGAELEGNALDLPLDLNSITYGHAFCVVTKRTTLHMQAAEIIFLLLGG